VLSSSPVLFPADSTSVPAQVRAMNNETVVVPRRETTVFKPVMRGTVNVSTLDWQNSTLPEGQQVTM